MSAATAPSYIANSTEELVPLNQVQQYVDELEKAGVPNQFDVIDGDLHAAQLGPQVWPASVDFLARYVTTGGAARHRRGDLPAPATRRGSWWASSSASSSSPSASWWRPSSTTATSARPAATLRFDVVRSPSPIVSGRTAGRATAFGRGQWEDEGKPAR